MGFLPPVYSHTSLTYTKGNSESSIISDMRVSLSIVKEIQLSSYGVAETDMNPFGNLDKFSLKSY